MTVARTLLLEIGSDAGALAVMRRESADPTPQRYEERVPVEAKQRALLLQIPPDALSAGIYQVDLEVRSEGALRGRGRFRLELSSD